MVRRIAVLAGIALIAALAVPMRPALACSCAEPTIDDLVARNSDIAIAVVRRIDRDGGARGVGFVEQALRGSLPEQVPLHLDDGASCRPWLGAGQLAALAFEPAGDSWRTVECGMVDPAEAFGQAYGAFRPDPDARGQPAVVLSGSMPGAGLVLLDDELRVLSVSPEPAAVSWLEACGDAVLTVEERPDGAVARLRSLPTLEVTAERTLGSEVAPEQVLDTVCAQDGSAAAVTRAYPADGGEPSLTFHGDLFAEDEVPLPPAEDAAIVGSEVLLLRSDHDGRASALDAHSIATGDIERRLQLTGVAAYELDVGPGGRDATIRGFAEEPILMVVEVATGSIIARTTGWWMPAPAPWLDHRRLLLVDENRGGGDAGEPAHRIVDLRLDEVGGGLHPSVLAASSVSAAEGLVIAVGGSELIVASPDGSAKVSADPRTATAWNAILVGRVSLDASTAPAAALPEPDADVAARGAGEASDSALPVVAGGLVAIAAFAAAATFLRLRRDRSQGRSG